MKQRRRIPARSDLPRLDAIDSKTPLRLAVGAAWERYLAPEKGQPPQPGQPQRPEPEVEEVAEVAHPGPQGTAREKDNKLEPDVRRVA